MKPLPIKIQDTVEVLPGCNFPGIVYSNGIVRTFFDSFAVVEFTSIRRSTDATAMEVFESKFWAVPWKYLRVLESAYDDLLGDAQEHIESIQNELSFCRSCLEVSEELREGQFDLIEKLIEEVDKLKAEVYHLRNLK